MEFSSERTLQNEESGRSKFLQTQRPLFDRNRINLESYQLIYFTEPGIELQNESNIQKLRKIVDYTKIFTDSETCQRHFQEPCDATTFMICANNREEKLISQIHDQKHLHSIYIYYQGSCDQVRWTSKYKKIIHVTDNFTDSLNKLEQDINNYIGKDRKQLFGSLHQEVIPKDKSTDDFHSWFIAFIDIICYLPYPENYFSLFIDIIKEYYVENAAEIQLIETFEVTYKPLEALNWYTRPTFLYRIMNKCLRQQKVEQTLLFGFFIQDMYRQLQVEHERFQTINSHVTTVFRGQVMTLDEINYLRPCGKIIINSFFSTTKDRSVALFFLDAMAPPDSGLQKILIEIDISMVTDKDEAGNENQSRIQSRPFADISHLSSVADESEILFMIGTLFIVRYHGFNEDENLWTLKLTLNYDDQVKVDKQFILPDGSQRRILKNCISSLPSFPFTYLNEDPSNKISNIFSQLKALYPSERWIEGYELWYIAKYRSKESIGRDVNSTSLIDICNTILSRFIEYLDDEELNCSLDMGNIHFDIGHEYEQSLGVGKVISESGDNYEQTLAQQTVLEHYNQAKRYYENALDKATTVHDRIQIFTRLVSIYSSTYYYSDMNDAKRKYMIATEFKRKCLEEMRKHKGFDSITIGKQLIGLSFMYDKLGMDDEALNIRLEALNVIPRSSSHMGFLEADFYSTSILDVLIRTYTEIKRDYSAASDYLQIKYENLLQRSHVDPRCLANEHTELATQYVKIGDFATAAKRLGDAVTLYKDSNMYDKALLIMRTEEELAEVYDQDRKYKEAYEHLFEALKWSEKETISFRKWSKRKIFDTHEKLANYCEKSGRNEEACEHLTQALKLCTDESCFNAKERHIVVSRIQEQIDAIRSQRNRE